MTPEEFRNKTIPDMSALEAGTAATRKPQEENPRVAALSIVGYSERKNVTHVFYDWNEFSFHGKPTKKEISDYFKAIPTGSKAVARTI